MKWNALILPPESMLETVCSAECRKLLEEHFHPVWNTASRDYTQDQLMERIGDADVVLTSWGSPILTEDHLREAKRLKMIGHAAGSLKGKVPDTVFQGRNIRLFSAAPRIALSVGEYCLAVLLNGLWRFPQLHGQVGSGIWRNGAFGRELRGQTVGIVSASATAKAFIRLLEPFQVQIRIYDPYLTRESAERLGAVQCGLEEIMRCPIISVHAPSIPETKNLLSAEYIRMIPDGAIFINSSRGAVLDEKALVEQLRTGRFFAALDVLEEEPPSPDHPLLGLDNVLLTPHVAGMTVEGCRTLMFEIVQDMIRASEGKPTRYEIGETAWSLMA
ncbi:hydroxyacid dehydrogenase [Cohnella hongkongensis]|uniref:Hydroxyacid dehydrogenase n=1 Tax=Cohnella hongkongensis TaxID=178337 RepID=A0ABV9F9D1_9BACL